MNRLLILLDVIQPPIVRAALVYLAGCASVGAGVGVFAGIVCVPVGLLWLTCRLVWGW